MSLAGGKGVLGVRRACSTRGRLAGIAVLCVLLLSTSCLALAPGAGAALSKRDLAKLRKRLPPNFFGISPNEGLPSPAEFARMRRGGIRTYRVPLGWSAASPNPSTFNWKPFDSEVAAAAAARLDVLPVIYSMPRWLGPNPLNLPVATALQQGVWQVFLQHAVRRYGPHGRFWATHRNLPYEPIHAWQIWNEENGVWYTEPVSVANYAKLLKISSTALKAADPKAKVVAGGLYGHPEPTGGALSASDFLAQLYQVKGIKSAFDVVGLHPYAWDVDAMRSQILEVRSVMRREGDGRTPLWLDEFGWGSGNRYSFDKGMEGQKDELVGAYEMLMANQRAWRIGRTYWFSWEDDPPPTCYYCSTSGLFTVGLTPKPSWYGYVEMTGGQP